MQGKSHDIQGAEGCIFAVGLPACFRMGSSFSATPVRPTAKKRLEVSPKVVCAIEFIGEILPEIPCFSYFQNSLISRFAVGGTDHFSHLTGGTVENCCTRTHSSIVCSTE